jgi:hypothetical protein
MKSRRSVVKYVYQSILGYRYASEIPPEECCDLCVKRILSDDDIARFDKALMVSSEFLYELPIR